LKVGLTEKILAFATAQKTEIKLTYMLFEFWLSLEFKKRLLFLLY